nr:spermidine synthase [uncultured Undibacterium sp.]
MAKKNTQIIPKPSNHPDVFVSEFRGVRSLHLASDVNSDVSCAPIQGSMRLAVPDQIELEYVQQMNLWMLFNMQPRHIVQLGLGAAALTKFCYRHFPEALVTAVDLNPKVIAMCRDQFRLPEDDERLRVIEMDAFDFVRNPTRRGKIDVIQVDLYDAEAEGPVLDSPEFYQACADCLSDEGMLTVNLFANDQQRAKNIAAMQACFEVVVWLPEVHAANVVAIGFKRAPEVDFELLYQRAAVLRVNYKLQAPIWVNGLKAWMQSE